MAGPLETALRACRALSQDDGARLRCYDALDMRAPAFHLAGHGSALSPPFEVEAHGRLVFESTDVIFVAYLLDAQGRVVQNLHHGGAGTGMFEIAAPGRYQVQINASGGWRVWLEAP